MFVSSLFVDEILAEGHRVALNPWTTRSLWRTTLISWGKAPSAAWRNKGITPSTACRWNRIQDGGLAVSNHNLVALHFKYDQARRRFVEWAQNQIAVVPDFHSSRFHKRILFSEEAHFWLNGYIDKQNCRIWSEANPQVYVETPLHPEKLAVWDALWAGGIIGPYFFKNDEGNNVTVNGDRYRATITNFFIPELNNHDV
ncbi:uncharacterized protein TNCV_450351 [Trichonephila clavipes]|nr:uncharacterized protein TNCV_450351 [Trichonephila clavipes]